MDFHMKRFLLVFVLFVSGLAVISCSGETTETTTVNTVAADRITIQGVGIVNKTMTLVKGDEVILNATVSPSDATNKTVQWTSSDEAVVGVDSTGKVSAVNVGNATISASNGEITESLTIVVINTVELSGIEFDQSNVSVNIGNEKQLTVIFTPSNANDIALFYSITPIGDAISDLVSVSATGLVSVSSDALPDTEYVVTAMVLTDSSIYAQCTISVNEIELTDLRLKKNDEALALNTSESIRLEVPVNITADVYSFVPIMTPTNTTQLDVTYTSTDTSVLTITEHGIYSVVQTAEVGDTVEVIVTGSNDISEAIYIVISEASTDVYHGYDSDYFDDLATDYRVEWDIEQYGTDGLTADNHDDYYDTAGNKPTTDALWRGGKTTATYGGVSPWDGVWGVIFDTWDHPYNDDDVANQYMFNKIAIGSDMNILKMRVRSHITQTTSERGKFRVGVITINEQGEYSEPTYLSLVQGTYIDKDGDWLVASNSTVADYEAGNDYFYYDISAYKNQTVIVIFEVDDMHDDGLAAGEMDSILCDRVAWLGAWLKPDTSEEE